MILSQSVEGAILQRQTTETQRLFFFIFSLQPPPSQATSLTCAQRFTLRATARWLGRRWCVSVETTDECREARFVVHSQFEQRLAAGCDVLRVPFLFGRIECPST